MSFCISEIYIYLNNIYFLFIEDVSRVDSFLIVILHSGFAVSGRNHIYMPENTTT